MIKGCIKTYLPILAVILLCKISVAENTPQAFPTADALIAHLKNTFPTSVSYDTNGLLVDVKLPADSSTDHNLRLLSQVKSVRHLCICCGGGMTSNSIPTLAEFPNLTGLGFVCCGGTGHIVPGLPSLTNLQSLYLAQTSYQTNDAIYLAKMTNLAALEIAGYIPDPPAELPPLTNLVNLRTLVIYGSWQYIDKVDTNMFSRLPKLTNLVVTSDFDNPALKQPVWKTPIEK